MAESSSQQPASQVLTPPPINYYWCYGCNKQVNVRTHDSQVQCNECHNGFVVSIPYMRPRNLNIANEEDLNVLRIRLQTTLEMLGIVGNPRNYVSEAGYQATLRSLAEADDGGDRGAPPAAESAVAALKNIKIEFENEAFDCAVCKDLVTVGETAKELPCRHSYHEDCIVRWLSTRNMCPVCRFELPVCDDESGED